MKNVFESNGYVVYAVNGGEYLSLEQHGMYVATFKSEKGAISRVKKDLKKYQGIEI